MIAEPTNLQAAILKAEKVEMARGTVSGNQGQSSGGWFRGLLGIVCVVYAADDGPLFSLLGFLMRSFPAKRAACCVNVLADVSASCALQFRPLFLYRRQRRSRGIRLQVVHELLRHTVAFPPKQIQAFTRTTHSNWFAHKKEE